MMDLESSQYGNEGVLIQPVESDFTKRKYNGHNLPVRVYTTRGLKEQGRFALENCHQVNLHWYIFAYKNN